MAVIYILKNTINNKIYIGQTTRLKKRMNAHENESVRIIDKAINKYKFENFKQYIFYVPESMLDYFEIEMIKKLNTIVPCGYNLTKGGGGIRGFNHTEETKRKMSKSLKGKKRSEETKRKMSEHQKGRKHSEETKLRISKALKGKIVSEETKIKMSKNSKRKAPWIKGKTHTRETKAKISKALKGENNPNFGKTGEKNSNWKGDNASAGAFYMRKYRKKIDEVSKKCSINSVGRVQLLHG